MSENDSKGGGGIFWAILLFLGGGAAFAINKFIGVSKDTNTGNTNTDGTTTGGTPKPSINPKPTVDKYSYGSQIMDGAGTAKNSNSDIEVSVSDITNSIVKRGTVQCNQYVVNLTINNKSTLSFYIESILLLTYVNGEFVGNGHLTLNTDKYVLINPNKSLSKKIEIEQQEYSYLEDPININMVDQYFNNPIIFKKIGVVQSIYDYGNNKKGNQDIIKFHQQKSLENNYDKKYNVNIYGYIFYRRNEKDVLDGGNLISLDLLSIHNQESSQPKASYSYIGGVGVGSATNNNTPISKSKYGIGNYMPKESELNKFYQK